MGLFDLSKKRNNISLSQENNGIVRRYEKFNQRTNTMQGRASDANGNTYMYETSQEHGISEQKIIKIDTTKDKKGQARQLKRQGYTQDEIADILGISQSKVSRLLRN